MLLQLPLELRELILSYFTRKEYKESVPCKGLLLCKSYSSAEKFAVLKELPKVNLSSKDLLKLFFKSCKYNNLWLADKLIIKFGVDPSTQQNTAIRIASEFGSLEIVDRLLQDPRVNPTDKNNSALNLASSRGHVKVVDRLLKDSRVDPSVGDSHALYCAVMNRRTKVIERLLEDPRVRCCGED